MTRQHRLSSGLLAGLLLTGMARSASASSTFPEALRGKLGLAQIAGPAPGCRLCHQTDVGGLKTATRPLGRRLLKAGAVGGSVPSLLAALDALEAEGSDSDHDGAPDISELEAGTDPNTAEAGAPVSPAEDVPLPQTGCALTASPSSAGVWTSLLCALGLLWRVRRRRG